MVSTLQFVIIIGGILTLSLDILLSFLNESKAKRCKNDLPEDLSGLMDHETWVKSSNYLISKTKLSYIQKVFSFLVSIFLLLLGLPWYFNSFMSGVDIGMMELSFFASLLVSILALPTLIFDWFNQFKIEEKYGFNKSSQGLWIKDKIKEILLTFILTLVVFSILAFSSEFLISRFESTWWIFCFLLFLLIQISFIFIGPAVIIPLFNKLTPLMDQSLASRLAKLCHSEGFELNKIEVIDGSKRSNHANAFFTGFGRARKIIFYDTLLEQLDHMQIESVLAHEIGHYKLHHLLKKLLYFSLYGFISFALLSFVMHSNYFFEQLNLSHTLTGKLIPVILYFLFFGNYFTYWLSFIGNFFSRKHEFEADQYAVNAVGDWTHLSSALRTLHVKNLAYPMPHFLYALFHHSHPSLIEREVKMKTA